MRSKLYCCECDFTVGDRVYVICGRVMCGYCGPAAMKARLDDLKRPDCPACKVGVLASDLWCSWCGTYAPSFIRLPQQQ